MFFCLFVLFFLVCIVPVSKCSCLQLVVCHSLPACGNSIIIRRHDCKYACLSWTCCETIAVSLRFSLGCRHTVSYVAMICRIVGSLMPYNIGGGVFLAACCNLIFVFLSSKHPSSAATALPSPRCFQMSRASRSAFGSSGPFLATVDDDMRKRSRGWKGHCRSCRFPAQSGTRQSRLECSARFV